MGIKLVDSEIKVMDVLWKEGDTMAKHVADVLKEQETDELLHKVFDGSVDKLFASLLGRKNLSAEQVEKLKQMVEELGGDGK